MMSKDRAPRRPAISPLNSLSPNHLYIYPYGLLTITSSAGKFQRSLSFSSLTPQFHTWVLTLIVANISLSSVESLFMQQHRLYHWAELCYKMFMHRHRSHPLSFLQLLYPNFHTPILKWLVIRRALISFFNLQRLKKLHLTFPSYTP